MRPGPRFIVTLAPRPLGKDGHGRDRYYRLKLALKALGRGFGLHAVRITEEHEPTPDEKREVKENAMGANYDRLDDQARAAGQAEAGH